MKHMESLNIKKKKKLFNININCKRSTKQKLQIKKKHAKTLILLDEIGFEVGLVLKEIKKQKQNVLKPV